MCSIQKIAVRVRDEDEAVTAEVAALEGADLVVESFAESSSRELALCLLRKPEFDGGDWTRSGQRYPCWPSMTPLPMRIVRSYESTRDSGAERSSIT